MMTKKKTSRLTGIKFVWALPAIALLLFAFAEPSYRAKNSEPRGKEVTLETEPIQKTVKLAGLVLDENGEPLPGTSIVIKGGTTGQVTDMDGKFELEIPENASVVLSFVGKKTIVDAYEGIISGDEKKGVFYRKYKMMDNVIVIDTDIPPPPPPAPKTTGEKLVPPPPPKVVEVPLSSKGEKEVFFVVEDMPQFPGGYAELVAYISKMQKKIAVSKKVNGKAKIAFTVNAKGKVSDIKIVEKDNDAAGKGGVMIASEMPDWTPGKQRGKAVPVKYLLPVEFK
jgi:hypothetical protein